MACDLPCPVRQLRVSAGGDQLSERRFLTIFCGRCQSRPAVRIPPVDVVTIIKQPFQKVVAAGSCGRNNERLVGRIAQVDSGRIVQQANAGDVPRSSHLVEWCAAGDVLQVDLGAGAQEAGNDPLMAMEGGLVQGAAAEGVLAVHIGAGSQHALDGRQFAVVGGPHERCAGPGGNARRRRVEVKKVIVVGPADEAVGIPDLAPLPVALQDLYETAGLQPAKNVVGDFR